MDITSLVFSFVSSNPNWRDKIEAITGQPAEHVIKCVGQMIDQIKSGPGVVDKEAVRQQKFSQIYNAGLRMGFSDWESEIAAAGVAGYAPIDIAVSFSQNRGWDVSVDEIENLAKTLSPRFMKKGKECGLFKDDKAPEKSKIPMGEIKEKGGTPPWRDKKSCGVVIPNISDASLKDSVK